jgi:hypothetical protein
MVTSKLASTGKQRRTAAQWHEAVQRLKISGLSVRAFCAREGLSVSGLYRWKANAASNQREQAAASSADALPPGQRANGSGSGFVDLGPLHLAAPSPSPSSAATAGMAPALLALNLRIDLGGGLVLRLERA